MKKLVSLAMLAASAVIPLNGQAELIQSELTLEKDPSGQFFTLKGYSTPESEGAMKELLKNQTDNVLELLYRANGVAFIALQGLKQIANESTDSNSRDLANDILEEYGSTFTQNLIDLKFPVTDQLKSITSTLSARGTIAGTPGMTTLGRERITRGIGTPTLTRGTAAGTPGMATRGRGVTTGTRGTIAGTPGMATRARGITTRAIGTPTPTQRMETAAAEALSSADDTTTSIIGTPTQVD